MWNRVSKIIRSLHLLFSSYPTPGRSGCNHIPEISRTDPIRGFVYPRSSVTLWVCGAAWRRLREHQHPWSSGCKGRGRASIGSIPADDVTSGPNTHRAENPEGRNSGRTGRKSPDFRGGRVPARRVQETWGRRPTSRLFQFCALILAASTLPFAPILRCRRKR
ncbi:hypothetical protein Zmor_013040 [Zophobas morio]|uniref:Uncharacterized protein n=1 Tax=Zophobas morio TaxID=2755281 RepID=A0AA38ICK0_9CUCU|nr:hypothetical protein Zmor_013040 [Zophobas morio]